MSKILVNAVGDACPIPVTKTIHALSGWYSKAVLTSMEVHDVELHFKTCGSSDRLSRSAAVCFFCLLHSPVQ